ncbi:hypothetical protein EV714DRAFT_205494 [Schizophyllum commune]
MRRSQRISSLRPSQRSQTASNTKTLNAPFDTRDPVAAVKSPTRKRIKGERNLRKEPEAETMLHKASSTSFLQDMPLDIVLEILGHVDPASLLHLARTSKFLRKYLMSRSSSKIWKKSFTCTDHGLPSPPTDMAIPSFVALIVDKFCHFCNGTSNDGLFIAWGARVRCCGTCQNNSRCFVRYESLVKFKVIKDIKKLFPSDWPTNYLPHVERSGKRWLLCRFLACSSSAGLTDTLYPRLWCDSLAREFRQQPENGKEKWFAGWKKKCRNIMEHARICEKWEREKKKREEEAANKVFDDRFDEIVRRLSDLGWEEDMQDDIILHEVASHKLVNKDHPLTEEGEFSCHTSAGRTDPNTEWTAMRRPLLKMLPKLRKERLEEERGTTLAERYRILEEVQDKRLRRKTHLERCFMPGVGDLADVKEVTDVVEGTPFKKELTKEDIQALIDSIPQAHWDTWNASREAALVDLLNKADTPRKRPATARDLQLATTVFTFVKYGPEYFTYPEVLAYRHPPHCVYSEHQGAPLNQAAWSTEGLSVDAERQRIAAKVVKLAGLDPKTATSADMDARDVWFASAKNVKACRQPLEALPWRLAVRSHLACPQGGDIVKLPAKRIAQARELRARNRGDSPTVCVRIARGR